MTDTSVRLIRPAQRCQDDTGAWRDSALVISKEIPARSGSVTRSEFSAAGQTGHRPERVLTLFAGEYHGETACEVDGVRYAIYRSYQPPGTDDMEIYLHREVGVHGANNAH